ncbi:MAG: hypothetical protein BRC22_00470 [Parcubacteria group bacterium QH_9_35_7]|nr:MAG: hypothetical protein BRC22_00470 [Parcubacteria group bacterium QH_9_35_7]
MSNRNLSGETEPQWGDFKNIDDGAETDEIREKENKTNLPQVSIPNRAEALDKEIIMREKIVHDKFECITGTKKKEKENKKNEDGVFFKETGKYSYFSAIDGIGSVNGYEATQEIMRLLEKKLNNQDKDERKELKNILTEINKKLHKNKSSKLSSCITAAQYNQETNELKVVNAGDTRGIVFNKEGKIKYLTEIQIHLSDVINWVMKNKKEKARKIREIMFKRGFENNEEIRVFSKELMDELLKEIDIGRRSAFAISSYLGNEPEDNEFDINSINIEPGDHLTLVTDGISSHDTLSEIEVVETIINAKDLETAMKNLIKEGKKKKSYDDASGLITKFK